MDKIFKFFIDRKILVNLIVIITIIAGFIIMQKIPREGMPAIDLNQLSIVTKYPGASPEDVELNITAKIESELREVDGLTEITSVSIENSSSILVQIDESMGRAKVQQIIEDVQKALDRINDLPEEVIDRPVLTELKTTDVPIIEIALSSKDKKYLRRIVKKFERKIEKLKGVAGVDAIGYFDKEIHIEVDPDKLNQAYFSLPEIIRSIQNRNLRSSSGTLESYRGLQNIVILNKFKNPLDVERVILRSNFDFKNIMLKQIARVRITEKDENLLIRNNGEPGISLIVRKKENADIIRTISRIKKIFNKKSLKQIKYSYVNDQSKTTRTRLRLLITNGGIGFILVILLLLLFLNRQSAFWTAFGIPFCFIASFIFLYLFNITLSAIVLSAFIIVLGLVVDDAIIVSEKISSYKEIGMDPKKASFKAVKEMAKPVVAAAITTVCAYIPIFFIGGRPGKFVWNIPVIVIIILCISLFESLFILPNHLSHGKTKAKTKAKWIIRIENIYENILKKALNFRYLLITGSVLLLIVFIILAKLNLKFQMFPQSNIDTFFIKIEGPKNQSLKETEKTIIKIENKIKTLSKKELSSFTSRIGHHSTSKSKNFGDHENWGIINVFLTPDTSRKKPAGAIIRGLKKKLKGPKGTTILFDKKKSGPIKDKPITLYVISNNEEIRNKAEEKILNFLNKMKKMGVTDVDTDKKEGKDELVVNMDHKKMAALGISTFDVAQSLRIAFDGSIVTSIQTPEEEIIYRLILNRKSRKKSSVIKKLGIKNKQGQLIKLSSFINFTTQKSSLGIYHRDGERTTTITAEVIPKKITAIEAAKYIKMNLLDKWDIPDDLEIQIAGEAKKAGLIFGDVKFAALLALILIFAVIAIMLDSLSQPLIIMSVIPFSLIGVLFALLIHSQNMSMFVLLAVISLTGIVVNDSIVMVNSLNAEIKNTKKKTNKNKEQLIDLISNKAKSRLRPILLTTFTTLGGLFPMAYGLGGYEKMLSPMALGLGWGLLFATLITLFLVPALYLLKYDIKNAIKKLFGFRKKISNKVIPILIFIILLSNNGFTQNKNILKLENFIKESINNNPKIFSALSKIKTAEANEIKVKAIHDIVLNIHYNRIHDNPFSLNPNYKINEITSDNAGAGINWIIPHLGTRMQGGMEYNQNKASLDPPSASPYNIDYFNPVFYLNINQPLLKNWFGIIDNFPIRQSKLNKLIIKETVDESIENIIIDLYNLYFDWYVIYHQFHIYSTNVKNSKILLNQIIKKYKDNLADKSDLSRIKIMNIKYEKEKDMYHTKYINITRKIYKWQKGVKSVPVKIDIIPEKTIDFPKINISHFSISNTRQMKILLFTKELLHYTLKKNKNELLPELNFIFSYKIQGYPENKNKVFNDFNYNNYKVGLELNYPIGGHSGKGQTEETKSKLKKWGHDINNFEISYTQGFEEVSKTLNVYKDILNYDKELIKQVKILIKEEEKKYQMGRSDLYYLIDNKNTLLKYNLIYIQDYIAYKKYFIQMLGLIDKIELN